jgi:hypothetical protein
LAAISAELRPFRAEEVEGADSRNGWRAESCKC